MICPFLYGFHGFDSNRSARATQTCRGRQCLIRSILMLAFFKCYLCASGISWNVRRGPSFTYDPPSRVDFSNSTGAVILCSADGTPSPSIRWVTAADGAPASDVPNLRLQRPDGSLVFPPFREDQHRLDIHLAAYRCLASNAIGSIASREVQIRAIVQRHYALEVDDESAVSGSTAVIRCHVPPYIEEYVTLVAWTEEPTGRVIQPSATPGGRYLTFPWPSLHIHNVDVGLSYRNYRCQTRNRLTGEVVESATAGRLIVTESRSSSRPRITDFRSQIRGLVGSTVALPCAAQGFPLPQYSWLREREKEGFFVNVRDPRFTRLEGTLLIREASLSDNGHYMCVANNSMGEDRTRIHLLLREPLSASISPAVQRAHAGRTWSVNCSLIGFPIHGVVWWKDAVPMDESTFQRTQHRNHNTLVIENFQRENSGMYQCFAFNNEESTQASVEISLQDGVPELTENFPDQTLQPGDILSLKCTAGGNPLPQISWFLDGATLPEDSHRVRSGDYVRSPGIVVSFVNVSSLKTEDSGNYKCVSDNGIGQVSHEALINIAGPPVLVRRRTGSNVTVVAGEVLILRCPVSGYPLEIIYWERANIRLPYNHRQKSHDNGTLEVHHVERSTDQGPYTCVASNTEGQSAQATVFVRVQVKPVIEPFSFAKQLREGQRATAVCTVSSGDLPIKIRWLKDGSGLPSDVRSSEMADYSSTLFFESLKLHHKGNYTCEASNEAGATSHSAIMVIHVPPRWVIEPLDAFVVRGKAITIDCQTEGFPQPRVRWKKAEGNSRPKEFKSVISSPHIQVFENGSLSVTNAREKDAGFYLCQATNGIGQGVSKVLRLKIFVAAHFNSKFTAEVVKKGHNTMLKCEALGNKPITVSWMKDKVSIKPQTNPRYELVETETKEGLISEIVIREADRRDSSLFSCLASNVYGQDDTNIQLTVQEPPSPPQELHVLNAGSRNVKLAWTTPAYNGNSHITAYIIHYKEETGKWHNRMNNVTVPGSETQGTVMTLRPFKLYFFRVIAENGMGRSEPTKPIHVVTEEEAPAAAPIKIRVHPVTSQSIKVTWKPPSADQHNGILKGYYVGYKAKASGDSYIYKTLEITPNKDTTSHENFNKEECHITGLRRNTQYSILVQAFNSKGAGPPSDEVLAHTLEHDAPATPPLSAVEKTRTSVRLVWDTNYDRRNPVTGFTIHYRLEGVINWQEERHVSGLQGWFDVQELRCGTRYQFQLTSYNGAGRGEPSDVLTTTTKGTAPVAPGMKNLLTSNATAASVDLLSWDDGGCSIEQLFVRFKEQKQLQWTVLMKGPPPRPSEEDGSSSLLDITGLTAGSWYQLQTTASNAAGSTDAEYTFAALAPSTEEELVGPSKTKVNRGSESSSSAFHLFPYLDMTILVPVAISILVIVALLIAVFFVVRKKQTYGGTAYGSGLCEERKGCSNVDLPEAEKVPGRKCRNLNSYPQPYATTELSLCTAGRRKPEDLSDTGYNQLQEEPLYATVKRTPRPPRIDGHIYHSPGLLLETESQNPSLAKRKEENEEQLPGCQKKFEDSKPMRNS